jgi:hypothetical protein
MKYCLWVLLIGLVACKSADVAPYSTEEAALVEKNLSNGKYTVELEWARPLNTAEMSRLYSSNMLPAISQSGQINILDSANYIKKVSDSLSFYLPYFGTRQVSVNPADSNSALRFEGVPVSYQVNFNQRKQFHTVNTKVKSKTETLNLSIQVYKSKKVQVNVNSSHRTSISYTGKIKWKE